ncbi:MAG: nucleoside monophosphate kinase [Candidatus Paceibacterota bacterium]
MKLFNNTSKTSDGVKATLKNLNGNHIQKVILLFGPPGAGKGTQSELLASKFYFYNLDTSRILEEKFKNAKPGERAEISGQQYSVDEELAKRRKGVLCSVGFTACLMNKRITEIHGLGKSLILSGSPRSLPEAEIEMPILEDLYGKDNIHVLFLDLPAEQTIFRNSNRRICELMHHSILYIPENADLKRCPLDGSRLIHRDLDNVETIKLRLEEYEQTAAPLEEFYRQGEYNLKKINANQYVENVFADILEALGPGFKVYEV